MPSPFPGMDPYIEMSATWSNVHTRLMVAIADALADILRPKYRVLAERAIYQVDADTSVLVGYPDASIVSASTTNQPPASETAVAVLAPSIQPITVMVPALETIRQVYLEIREIGNDEVVTIIELLSPANKASGKGREQYEIKRQRLLDSMTHLVEIDLLRAGLPMPMLGAVPASHYRILISRSQIRPQADLYAFNLPDQIPSIPVPLKPADPEPAVELQHLFASVYDRSGYDIAIDYRQPPQVPLSPADATWVDQWLRQQGLRA